MEPGCACSSAGGHPHRPPLLGSQTLLYREGLLAEQLLPVLARASKSHRMTVVHTTWISLNATTTAVFAAISDSQERSHRVAAATAFDAFKWNLRLLETQRLVAPGTIAAMSGDVTEVGKMIGGMLRKTPSF
jgi:hypothetical protein